jgi:hypothetical protein
MIRRRQVLEALVDDRINAAAGSPNPVGKLVSWWAGVLSHSGHWSAYLCDFGGLLKLCTFGMRWVVAWPVTICAQLLGCPPWLARPLGNLVSRWLVRLDKVDSWANRLRLWMGLGCLLSDDPACRACARDVARERAISRLKKRISDTFGATDDNALRQNPAQPGWMTDPPPYCAPPRRPDPDSPKPEDQEPNPSSWWHGSAQHPEPSGPTTTDTVWTTTPSSSARHEEADVAHTSRPFTVDREERPQPTTQRVLDDYETADTISDSPSPPSHSKNGPASPHRPGPEEPRRIIGPWLADGDDTTSPSKSPDPNPPAPTRDLTRLGDPHLATETLAESNRQVSNLRAALHIDEDRPPGDATDRSAALNRRDRLEAAGLHGPRVEL